MAGARALWRATGMTDKDFGKPIIAIANSFTQFVPGHVHLHEIGKTARRKAEYIYTYSEAELRQTLASLRRSGRPYKEDIQRYKGLGEMDANQLAETTMDPAKRTLRRITVDDAERAEEVFALLMGSDVAPRKEFIVQGAASLDRDRIDA